MVETFLRLPHSIKGHWILNYVAIFLSLYLSAYLAKWVSGTGAKISKIHKIQHAKDEQTPDCHQIGPTPPPPESPRPYLGAMPPKTGTNAKMEKPRKGN